MPAVSAIFWACALGYAALALAAVLPRVPGKSAIALALAAAVTAAWAALLAMGADADLVGPAASLDFVRTGAWFWFLLVLARRIGDARSRWWASRGIGALFALMIVACAILAWRGATMTESSLISLGVDARLGFAVAILLLIENLYRNASRGARWHVNLSCIAVGGIYLYEIIYWSNTILYHQASPVLAAGQAPVNLLVIPLLFLGARRQRRWRDEVGVSRSVIFHTATLVLAGVFLVGLAAAGEVFRRFGSGWGVLAEASLLFGGCLAIAVFATSGSARSRLRRLVVDHFFTHRFDYQREWIRCIATLSAVGPHVALHGRVIRAVADVVDSPGGALFLRERTGGEAPPRFCVAGNWNAAALDDAVVSSGHPLLSAFRSGEWIAVHQPQERAWFAAIDVWLAVPLPAAGGPDGFIVLLPPRARFSLDQEVFDLLRVVGHEVAVFVAEQRATEALVEARQFAERGQRFAFVAHDIKNVASQLSLLVGNAEQHLDEPEFRVDMLTTLRASVQKITALLGRLQGSTPLHAHPLLHLRRRLEAIIRSYAALRSSQLEFSCDTDSDVVAMDGAAFDAVIRHLIDNAIEAVSGRSAIKIRLFQEDGSVVITVTDRGRGMEREFIRDVLFRPFASTKPAGFGLGAFQARSLLREVGGDLVAASTPGWGTTMRITLPLTVAPISVALRA